MPCPCAGPVARSRPPDTARRGPPFSCGFDRDLDAYLFVLTRLVVDVDVYGVAAPCDAHVLVFVVDGHEFSISHVAEVLPHQPKVFDAQVGILELEAAFSTTLPGAALRPISTTERGRLTWTLVASSPC